MIDLPKMMLSATGIPDETPSTTVESDLARGHRARLVRRLKTSALSTATLLVVVTVVMLLPILVPAKPVLPHGPGAAITLVRYTQPQPQGFVIDVVPKGWHVLKSSEATLLLGPEDDSGAALSDAGTSFMGRIAVTLDRAPVPADTAGSAVVVDGITVLIRSSGGSGVITAVLRERADEDVIAQLPAHLGWTNRQVAQFVIGLHPTSSAVPSVG